jgi:hypothetical protein
VTFFPFVQGWHLHMHQISSSRDKFFCWIDTAYVSTMSQYMNIRLSCYARDDRLSRHWPEACVCVPSRISHSEEIWLERSFRKEETNLNGERR